MQTVVVLALDDVIAFDLATPVEVFGRARLPDGSSPYRVLVAGPAGSVTAGPLSLTPGEGLEALLRADTVVVPGLNDPTRPVATEVTDILQQAYVAGTRIASICVGAFTLAAAGLLDGRRATTHWRASGLLANLYPRVTVDPAVLFVDEGQVLTSAGAAAGLDLCLHMIHRDHGPAVASDAARTAVMPMTRAGGQAQFIAMPAVEGFSLAPTLRWVEDHAHQALTVDAIAAHARLSSRTLSRRFHEQTGLAPLQWVTRTRIRQAQSLLESTSHSIERIARQTGFGSAANLRVKFRATLGTSPAAYRTSFSAPPPVESRRAEPGTRHSTHA